jgi:hypothetical protein
MMRYVIFTFYFCCCQTEDDGSEDEEMEEEDMMAVDASGSESGEEVEYDTVSCYRDLHHTEGLL